MACGHDVRLKSDPHDEVERLFLWVRLQPDVIVAVGKHGLRP
jgi:hypothetical protein